jgi:hypothetical protein
VPPAGNARLGPVFPSLSRSLGTIGWFTLVSLTQGLLLLLGGSAATGLLTSASTNLGNIEHGRLYVFLASAIMVSSSRGYLLFAAECLLFLAPLEQWIGTRRWLAGAIVAHVGTSAIVAAGLVLISHHTAAGDREIIDVGVSYAARFLIAILAYRHSGRARAAFVLTLLVFSGGNLLFTHTLYQAGHLVAALLGLTLAPLFLKRQPSIAGHQQESGPAPRRLRLAPALFA